MHSVSAKDTAGNHIDLDSEQSDGTTKIVEVKGVPYSDGSPATQYRTITMSAPDATTGEVKVTGVSSQVVAGQGDLAGSVPLTGTGVTVNVDTSSLAKETTLQGIQAGQSAQTSAIENAITSQPVNQTFAGGSLGTYPHGTDTVNAALDDFSASVSALPIVSQTAGFFTVTGGGSCPVFTLPETAWTPSVTLDVFCGDLMTGVINVLGGVMMVGAAWVAFKWAFL